MDFSDAWKLRRFRDASEELEQLVRLIGSNTCAAGPDGQPATDWRTETWSEIGHRFADLTWFFREFESDINRVLVFAGLASTVAEVGGLTHLSAHGLARIVIHKFLNSPEAFQRFNPSHFCSQLQSERSLIEDAYGPASVDENIAGAQLDEFTLGPEWLRVVEAETISGINRGVISRAANAGELKSNGKHGRDRRIDVVDFARWQLERAHQPEQQDGCNRQSALRRERLQCRQQGATVPV